LYCHKDFDIISKTIFLSLWLQCQVRSDGEEEVFCVALCVDYVLKKGVCFA